MLTATNIHRTWKTADGHVVMMIVEDAQFRAICRAIDREDLERDPRFDGLLSRLGNGVALYALLEVELAKWTTAELVERARRFGAPLAPVNGVREFMADPQARANRTVFEVEDPRAGTLRQLAHPARYSRLPPRCAACRRSAANTPTRCSSRWGIRMPRSARCARAAPSPEPQIPRFESASATAPIASVRRGWVSSSWLVASCSRRRATAARGAPGRRARVRRRSAARGARDRRPRATRSRRARAELLQPLGQGASWPSIAKVPADPARVRLQRAKRPARRNASVCRVASGVAHDEGVRHGHRDEVAHAGEPGAQRPTRSRRSRPRSAAPPNGLMVPVPAITPTSKSARGRRLGRLVPRGAELHRGRAEHGPEQLPVARDVDVLAAVVRWREHHDATELRHRMRGEIGAHDHAAQRVGHEVHAPRPRAAARDLARAGAPRARRALALVEG